MRKLCLVAVPLLFITILPVTWAHVNSAFQTAEAAAPCVGGNWSPSFVSRQEYGSPQKPAFHTIWGYACGGTVYMLRLSNSISGPPAIRVDVISKTGSVPCAGQGKWTPGPISRLETGGPTQPAFHTVWGYACNNAIYMLRFSNRLGPQKTIAVDSLGNAPAPCFGEWSPEAVSKFDVGSADAPAFHTIWGYACGGNAYMVRFSNQIAPPPEIRVDVLTQGPIQ